MGWAAAGFLAVAWLAFFPGLYDSGPFNWALLSLLAAGYAADWIVRSWRERAPFDAPAGIALGLLGWCALSLFWSVDWRNGLSGLIYAGVCFTLFCWARAETVQRAVILGSLGACVLLFWPATVGGFGNPNFLAEFLIAGLPFLAVSRYGKYLALIAALVLMFQVDALIGAVVGGTFTPATSLGYRLELWGGTLLMWADSPFIGQGLGSFDYLFPFYAPDTELLSDPDKFAGAAHNDFLQLLAELGLIGAGLVVWLLRQIRRPRTSLEWAALASLGLTGCLALIGFPLQNPATASLAALSLGLLARPARWSLSLMQSARWRHTWLSQPPPMPSLPIL